jgi:sulfate adenylyltransferase
MTSQILPHGGELVNRVLSGSAREAALERADRLLKLQLNEVNLADLEMLANGALSPLKGFMERADYQSVVHHMRLANGLPWTLPITLAVDALEAAVVQIGQEVALCEYDRVLAILEVRDKFSYSREVEAQTVYRTLETAHPSVARLASAGDILLGGPIHLLSFPQRTYLEFPDLRHKPADMREIFAQRGWRRIVGFQTRNLIHRAHEYIQKMALEIVDGLLLHPLAGDTQSDDIPAHVRMKSYKALLEDYYPPSRVLLAAFPAVMRYAGPREAVFHAIIHKNYGCTHFIVGRDHASIGKYYGTYDAHLIFDEFKADEIDIMPLFFERTFYCRRCGGIVSLKTCPHSAAYHVILSGTQVREMLMRGEMLPQEFTRPEVSRLLVDSLR